MNVKRFVLRLAVGLLCFMIGWACATLLGLAGPRGPQARRVTRVELVPQVEVPPPMPFKSGCRAPKVRHAHEWHDVPRLEEFDVPPPPPPAHEDFPAPPPPPPHARPRRGGS